MPVSSGEAATMLFAAGKEVSKNHIFGASAALIVVTVKVVIAGTVLWEFIYEKCFNFLAGAGFILIGAITLVRVSPLRRLTPHVHFIEANALTLDR
tara:strand:+ start:954 stop:1241 length:288 start_codon:yes stop_codon:yes gene_type:complete